MSGENSFTFIAPPSAAAPRSPARRFASSPALLLFLVGLIAGAAVVGWRANARYVAEKDAARSQAAAKAALLEAQFGQALSAAEVLAGLTRQAGGPLANFQAVASDLRLSRPLITAIELQPGGVTTEVVPRPGNDRLLGFNTLTHPAHQVSASAALGAKAIVVAAPLPLPGGAQGLVVRVPVFRKGRDGRETSWGLMSVTMRLPDVMGRVALPELSKAGYDYALYIPGSGRQKVTTLALQGRPSLNRAVQAPVEVRNLKASLAVERHGGWFDTSRLLLECFVVLVLSGALSLAYNLFESRRAAEHALSEAQRRSERETADRARAQEETRAAQELLSATQADLKRTLSRLQQTENGLAEVSELKQQAADREYQAETAHARAQQAEIAASKLRQELEHAQRIAEQLLAEHERQDEKAQAIREKLETQVGELQKKLEGSARSAVEFAASAQAQLQESRDTIAELKSRLETVSLETLEAEDKTAARLAAAQQENIQLKADLAAARQAGARAVVREGTLGQAETDTTAEPPDSPAELPAALQGDSHSEDALPDSDAAVPTTPAPPKSAFDPAVSADPEVIAAVPSARETPTRPSRRKKTKRDHQMDLFGGARTEPAPEQAVEGQIDQASDTTTPEPESAPEPMPGDEPGEPRGLADGTSPEPSEPAVEEEGAERVPAADFPEIEGLAVTEGLAWAEGNARAYWKALRQFAERQAGAAENIRAALEQGALADAERAVQTLKTASGDIAAVSLHGAAGALARGIHEQADPAELEGLWETVEHRLSALLSELKRVLKPREDKAPHRHLPAPNPAELRKAASLMMPLLVDGDPGAKDCLKDNRNTFRSAFSPEAYQDFEHCVRKGEFESALESLRKAARKHGIGL